MSVCDALQKNVSDTPNDNLGVSVKNVTEKHVALEEC